MIWNHSEQDLHDFISKINNCHDSMKFTFNYSTQEVTFLDVNIKMKANGELDTSVHKKVTNCHQYIEVSSCHPLSCKQGIPHSQAKRYRLLRWITHVLKKILTGRRNIFLTRNYPKQVIDEAFGNVSSMSMDDALKPTSHTKCQSFCMHLQILTLEMS